MKNRALPALRPLSVRFRLLATLILIGALLAGPALYGIGRLQAVRDIAVELHDRHSAARAAVGGVRTALAETDRLLRSYIVTGDPTARDEMMEALLTAREDYRLAVDAGYGLAGIPLGLTLAGLEGTAFRIDELVRAGDGTGATEGFGVARTLLLSSDSAIDVMASTIDRQSADATARAEAIASRAAATTLFALAGALALALFIGLTTTNQLTRPLERLRAAMSSVAEGEFEAQAGLDIGRRDELGDLARSFDSMTKQLSELSRLKAEFVSKTSHNLKTPLNVIGGYAEMLEEGSYGTLEEAQIEPVRAIRDQVDTLAAQVGQLADLGRVEAHAFTVRMRPLTVGDLLLGLRRSFEALARQRDIDFAVTTDSSAPKSIVGDEDRLRNEALGNLLANAFKFCEAGDSVTVCASGSEGRLEIEVSDTGAGIDPPDLAHIFDRYYQAANGRRAGGSGLGLAIAREIVDGHGGTITASSGSERGTVFKVVLPVGDVAALSSPEPVSESAQSGAR